MPQTATLIRTRPSVGSSQVASVFRSTSFGEPNSVARQACPSNFITCSCLRADVHGRVQLLHIEGIWGDNRPAYLVELRQVYVCQAKFRSLDVLDQLLWAPGTDNHRGD